MTAYMSDGTTDSLNMTDATNFHVSVEFIPGVESDLSPDIDRVVLTDFYGTIADTEVVFDRECTPPDPFYVRWINRQGGFEYQMFDENKTYEKSASGFVEFFPSFADTAEASRTREIIDITGAKATAAVGIELLDRDEFDRISTIMFSPRIDVYNRELTRWEGITLDNTTRATWDTRTSRGTLGFVFRLKDIQLQF